MKYSIALTEDLNNRLLSHLLRDDGQESLCFGLWMPSTGTERLTGLIKDIILPEKEDINIHGNVSFNPCYLEKVIDIALKQKAGIAFLHSHPFPGWQSMSTDDVAAETRLSKTVVAVTGLPLLGLTTGNDGTWSGRFWIKNKLKYKRVWAESVRVLGAGLNVSFNNSILPPPKPTEELLRTISSWGEESQAKLARLHIGVVGLGSVGSIVAENLARCGIGQVTLIDFDTIERKNRDRVLYATKAAVGKPKVNIIANGLKLSATANPFRVKPLQYSIVEAEGFKAALNCDILLSCVDRPWARYVLNGMSYAHLIPVIDGGISVRVKANGKIRGADWKAHTVGPGKLCLECNEQYSAELVSLEMSGLLDDPSYIEGLPKEHLVHSNQNVFSFSLNLAALEVQQLLSMVIQPSGIPNVGRVLYHFVDGTLEKLEEIPCKPNCSKPSQIACGDLINAKLIAPHIRAEATRVNSKRNKL